MKNRNFYFVDLSMKASMIVCQWSLPGTMYLVPGNVPDLLATYLQYQVRSLLVLYFIFINLKNF